MESFHFILAMKIWERHELLEVTVGYFNEELVSYENATTLVMVVTFLFPVLSLLEILLYLTYQKRVWSLFISIFICFPFPFSSIHGVKLSRATLVVDVDVHIVVPVPLNVCQSQTVANVAKRWKKMRWWKRWSIDILTLFNYCLFQDIEMVPVPEPSSEKSSLRMPDEKRQTVRQTKTKITKILFL